MLIDTHCHLHDREWFSPEQAEDFLQKAHASGVEKIICIGTDPQDSLVARDFASSHPNTYWTYGIHPEFCRSPREENVDIFFRGDAQNNGRSDFANDYVSSGSLSSSSELFANCVGVRAKKELVLSSEATPAEDAKHRTNEERAKRGVPVTTGDDEAGSEKKAKNQNPPVAIGEIGLDYHYEGYDRSTQIHLFEQMLQLARDHQLPVSLHIREAFADAFPILDNFPEIEGVVHSFTGNKRELKQALDRGFYIGVNGYVTYATPPIPPLNCILLETDAPFLTPVPFRGTINTPKYVKYVAACLSEKLGVAEEVIVEQTTNHARKLFKI